MGAKRSNQHIVIILKMKKQDFVFIFSLVGIFAPFIIFPQVFDNRVDLGLIEYNPIDEASGIAASRKKYGCTLDSQRFRGSQSYFWTKHSREASWNLHYQWS